MLIGIALVVLVRLSKKANKTDVKTADMLALAFFGMAVSVANDAYNLPAHLGKLIDLFIGLWITTIVVTSIYWRVR